MRNMAQLFRFLLVGLANTRVGFCLVHLERDAFWTCGRPIFTGYGCGLAVSFALN